jgi:hypothetical protein
MRGKTNVGAEVPVLAEGFLKEDLQRRNAGAITDLKAVSNSAKNMNCEQDSLALCLGAGIGADIGLPLWPGLIQDLLLRTCVSNSDYFKTNGGIDLKNASLFQNINPLEAVEYVYMFSLLLQEDDNFFAAETKGDYLGKVIQNLLRRKVNKGDECFDLLKALSTLILSPCGSRQILTYNFDNALEYTISILQKNGVEPNIRINSIGLKDCVYRRASENERNIYHIHGRLNILGDADAAAEDDDTVVLSESSYQTMEKDVYNRVNTCHAQFLHAHHCLFIGCSGQDYHFRKLVRKDAGKPRHFIALAINSLILEIFDDVSPKKAKATKDTNKMLLLQSALDLQRKYYEQWSFQPIYFIYDTTDTQKPRNDLTRLIEYIAL